MEGSPGCSSRARPARARDRSCDPGAGHPPAALSPCYSVRPRARQRTAPPVENRESRPAQPPECSWSSRHSAGVLDLGDDAVLLVEELLGYFGPSTKIIDGRQLLHRGVRIGRIVGTLDLRGLDRGVERPESVLSKDLLAGIGRDESEELLRRLGRPGGHRARILDLD